MALVAGASSAATYVAQVSNSGVVSRVIATPDVADPETFAKNLLGGNWKRTYIDASQRGIYAGPGRWFQSTANTFDGIGSISIGYLGDSITANMATAQSALNAPFTSGANYGVSGNTAAQIAARVSSVSANNVVIVEAGTNDLVGLGTAAGIIPAYTTILNTLTPTKLVIVWGIPQVDEAQLNITHPGYIMYLNNSLIATQNAAIAALCLTYQNCVPATATMAYPVVGLTSDGIHPVQSAYPRIIATLPMSF